jgi:PAS domain S-box-containing protein
MKAVSRNRVIQYAVVVAAVAIATALRKLLGPVLGDQAPFVLHWPVVIFAAWYAGAAAGVLATPLSALAVDFFLLEPVYSLRIAHTSQVVGLVLFVLLGVGVSLLIGRLQRAAYQAEGRARQSYGRRAKLEKILRTERVALARAVREVERRRVAEEALRQSEAQYRLLAESAPQMVWMTRPGGSAEYFNSRWREYTGQPPEESLGWGWEQVVHPDDRPEALEAWNRSLTTGTPFEVQYRLRRADGEYRWHIARALPLQDEGGEVVRWVGTCTDLHDQKTAQADLSRANERFRLAADAVAAVIYDWDPVSNRVERTRGLFEVLGYRPEEAEPTNTWWRQQIHPDDRERVTQHWQEMLVQGDRYVLEYRLRHKDGDYLHVLDRGTLVRDATGRLVRAVGSAQDITARVHSETALRASETRFRFLAESGGALAASLDPDATLRTVARLAVPALADICVIHLAADGDLRLVAAAHADPAKEALLLELGRAYRPTANPRSRILQVARTGVAQLFPDTAEEPSRSAFAHEGLTRLIQAMAPQSWLVVPLVARGRTLGTVSLLTAESGRRYDADDLAQAEELARRAALALDNARLYTDAREADRRKDEFLAMLGHELRNPLAPIVSSLHLLRRRASDDPETAAARDTIDRQVRHLTRLVDDLLDVARITRGKVKLQRQPVELARVIAAAVEIGRPLMDARRHALTVALPDEPVWLFGDPARLTQVFGNLLANAAKYMEEGGSVTLAAERAAPPAGAGGGRQFSGEAVVRVRDRGMGIPAEMLPHVFELFTQVGSTLDRAQGGLGIGLSLVRRLVELHGGRVEAHSDGPGAGSEFVVRLPALAAAPAPKPAPVTAENGHAAGEPPAACGVLVTDDNRDAADSLARLLRAWGHAVRVTYDGPEAIAAARDFRPQVVLLDIGLGGMTGYEVAQHLRRDPGLNGARLIALTGFGQEEDRRRSKEAGFDHHLVKPVDPDELRRLLAEAAAGRSEYAPDAADAGA